VRLADRTMTCMEKEGVEPAAERYFLAVVPASGMNESDMAPINIALEAAAARLTTADRQVRFWQSYLLPTAQRWVGVFETTEPELVTRALSIAQLRAVEITEAIANPDPPMLHPVDTERSRRHDH